MMFFSVQKLEQSEIFLPIKEGDESAILSFASPYHHSVLISF